MCHLPDNVAIAPLVADFQRERLAIATAARRECADRAQQVANVIADRAGTELQLFRDLFRGEPPL